VQNVGQYPRDILFYRDMGSARLWVRRGDLVVQILERSHAACTARSAPDSGTGPPSEPAEPPAIGFTRRVSHAYIRFPEGLLGGVEAEEPTPAKLNFFRGDSTSAWWTDIPTFHKVRVRDLYPGVDLVMDSRAGTGLGWALQGTDPAVQRRVRLEVDTRANMTERNGSWAIRTSFGEVAFAEPRFRSDEAASPRPDTPIPAFDPGDQTLLWGTYIGGYDDENAVCHLQDAEGNILLGGWSSSPDIPVPDGYETTYQGGYYDIYLAKLSATGSQLLWATFIGGDGYDSIRDMVLDTDGNIVLSGITSSVEMPVPGGFQIHYSGNKDGYVAKMAASGAQLFWGTYVGGSLEDECDSVCLDGEGNVFVAGKTSSANIPTPGGWDQTFNGGAYDIYLARLAPSGSSQHWGTYLGGAGDDRSFGLAVDGSGDAVVAGYTESADIPTTPGAFDAMYHGNGDLYAAKLSGADSQIRWGTYVGGSGDDGAYDVVLDSEGNLVLAGFTSSPDIPVPCGYQQTHGGGDYDHYLAELSTDGSSLLWGTYFGAGCTDYARGISLDSAGALLVSGRAEGPGMPCGGFDETFNGGGRDIFLSRFSPDGAFFLWGTYLGGSDGESCYSRPSSDGQGGVVIAGAALSADIPTPGGYDSSYNGAYTFYTYGDIYVAKLSGLAEPGCLVNCSAGAVPLSGDAPLFVTFTGAAAVTDCAGQPTFSWTFGNGATSAEQSPGQTYAEAGTYTWTLTVTVEGETCTQSGTVTVTEPCTLTCEGSAEPTSGTAPLDVTFSSSATASHCAGQPQFSWSFGDGATSSEPSPGHTYAEPGTYAWTLTAIAGGKTCSASGSLTANPGLPGDANNDGAVSIGEVQQAINMFLGTQAPGNGVDCKSDGIVSIGEVQKVINAFLGLSSSC
jgi:hypothetical protein